LSSSIVYPALKLTIKGAFTAPLTGLFKSWVIGKYTRKSSYIVCYALAATVRLLEVATLTTLVAVDVTLCVTLTFVGAPTVVTLVYKVITLV
jgi:hypothetical protein